VPVVVLGIPSIQGFERDRAEAVPGLGSTCLEVRVGWRLSRDAGNGLEMGLVAVVATLDFAAETAWQS
jgi:hypothetical protein